ncbi:MAG: hypothetical protein LBQ12_07615, partial [Deltaproteobacteria bacterium]|nr:hypothetical protein [Deltaproteobacteria bacterium]
TKTYQKPSCGLKSDVRDTFKNQEEVYCEEVLLALFALISLLLASCRPPFPAFTPFALSDFNANRIIPFAISALASFPPFRPSRL